MKKISKDNKGISMLLVIIVVVIVAVAAAGAVFILTGDDKNNNEEAKTFTITHKVTGQINSGSAVFIYLNDQQIDERRNISGDFTIEADKIYNLADWPGNVTLRAEMVNSSGTVIQTVKKDLTVSATNNSHDVSLAFYNTKIDVSVSVEFPNDATITVSLGDNVLGTFNYNTSPNERTFTVDNYTIIPYDSTPTITIKAVATFQGGYEKPVSVTKNVIKNGTVEFNLVLAEEE